MVAFKITSLAFVASAVSAMAYTPSVANSGLDRREVLYRLRQRYPVNNYAAELDNKCITQDGLDTVNPQTGACICGVGRQPTAPGANTCSVIPAASNFDVNPAPKATTVALTWELAKSGDPTLINEQMCGAFCAADSAKCIGWYLSPGAANTCYLIGQPGAYANLPSINPNDGAPIHATVLQKRATTTYTIGAPGGKIGAATAPVPPAPGAGCDGADGDVYNSDFTCTCGPGRVNVAGNPSACQLAPSAGAHRLARSRRHFNGVQW